MENISYDFGAYSTGIKEDENILIRYILDTPYALVARKAFDFVVERHGGEISGYDADEEVRVIMKDIYKEIIDRKSDYFLEQYMYECAIMP